MSDFDHVLVESVSRFGAADGCVRPVRGGVG